MHVDTGHNFPEVLEYRDRRVAELGVRLVVALGAGRRSTPAGWSRRPAREPAATGCRPSTLLDAIEEHGFDAAFGGARRDEEKARAKERVFSLPRRVRPVGPEEPAARAVEPLQRPAPPGRAHPGLPAVATGPSSTSGSTSAPRSIELPVDLLRPPSARCSSATACCWPVTRFVSRCRRARVVRERTVRFRTVGDVTCTGAVESDAADRRRGHRRGRRHPAHRARRHPRRRPDLRGRHGRPQAGGLLLMAKSAAASPPPAPSTTASPRSSAGCSTTPSRSSRTSSRPSSAPAQRTRRRVHQPRAAHRRPARRARAGHHHRRGLPLLRHAQAQVHHRRHPGPHPVHPQHGHRRLHRRPRASCWSTPARACSSSPAATPSSPRCCASRTWCSPSTRWTWSTTTEERFERDRGRVPRLRHEARRPRPDVHPDLGAARRQRRDPLATNMPWYEGPSLLHHLEHVYIASDRNLVDVRFPVQYVIRPQSATSTTTTAATPARSPAACSSPATRSSCCPSGFTSTDRRDRHRPTARSTRRSRRCR